jgi:hypothetical protein
MPPEGASVETEETAGIDGGQLSPDASLSDAQLRDLAEILYKMILAELRVERERLGR